MVTPKRRITTDQDHFGGYRFQRTSRMPIEEDDISVSDFDTYAAETTYTESSYAPTESRYETTRAPYLTTERTVEPTPSVITYSPRPDTDMMVVTPPTTTAVGTKKARKKNKEEVMPSIRRREENYEREESYYERTSEKKTVSVKTKAALIVYAVTVVALAIVVIVMGVAISNINATSEMLETQITQANEYIAVQNSEIERITDTDYVMSVAQDNGMEKADGAVEVELVPTVDPIKYEGSTNWFDKFCDFISNIIGG